MILGEQPLTKETPSRRLLESEWLRGRNKRLCFKRDEKYTQGHRCKNCELRMLLVFDDEDNGSEGQLGAT